MVLDQPVTWTLGFQVSDEEGSLLLGMGGAGGCAAWADSTAGYGRVFPTRRLGGLDRVELVREAVAACV